MGEPTSTRAATAALVLSILSWLVFLATYSGRSLGSGFGDAVHTQPIAVLGPLLLPPFAIVFGHLGMRRARAGAGCRGRATAALVLGYLALALGAARLVCAAMAR